VAFCRATALSAEEEVLTTRRECEVSHRRNQVSVTQERSLKSRLRRGKPKISPRVRKWLRGGEQSLDPGAASFIEDLSMFKPGFIACYSKAMSDMAETAYSRSTVAHFLGKLSSVLI
jgi:hypothetical protein